MLLYDEEDGRPQGVEVDIDDLNLAFDIGAEEENGKPIFIGDPYELDISVAELGRLKELLSAGILARLIPLGREQDRLLRQRKAA